MAGSIIFLKNSGNTIVEGKIKQAWCNSKLQQTFTENQHFCNGPKTLRDEIASMTKCMMEKYHNK